MRGPRKLAEGWYWAGPRGRLKLTGVALGLWALASVPWLILLRSGPDPEPWLYSLSLAPVIGVLWLMLCAGSFIGALCWVRWVRDADRL